MDFQKTKTDLQHIVELAGSVPNEFRKSCFELLLRSALSELSPAVGNADGQAADFSRTSVDVVGSESNSPPLTKEFRAFISRTGLTTDEIFSVVHIRDGVTELLQPPITKTKAQGQIQVALLRALLSGASGKSLDVDADEVREMCREYNYYDEANFAATFRKNAALFNAPPRSGGPRRRLSLDGERQLAQLIRDQLRQK